MKAAVLGSPIAHSLSPVLHQAGYAELGLAGWSYQRFELVAAELPAFVAGLDADWRGLSLTMPLKSACLEVAAAVTPLAARAGAGNTLVRQADGSWLADNTDIPGLVAALRPAWESGWRTAAVLGAGATARSALLALAELGVAEVNVYARDAAKAEAVAGWAPAELAVRGLPLASWARADEPAVLSTLPGGAADALSLPDAWCPGSASRPGRRLFFDAVYADWPTPLARAAAAAGATVVSGLDLLVQQAALQFELFTGHQAPVAAMFAAGRAALGFAAPAPGGEA